MTWYFEYYLATVPGLAIAGGVQPIVYLEHYDDKPIAPIASNVDRAFDLWAREFEFRLQKYGALDVRVEAEDIFPWSRQESVAQDEELVRMLEESRFDELVAPTPEVQEWVEEVIAAARARR